MNVDIYIHTLIHFADFTLHELNRSNFEFIFDIELFTNPYKRVIILLVDVYVIVIDGFQYPLDIGFLFLDIEFELILFRCPFQIIYHSSYQYWVFSKDQIVVSQSHHQNRLIVFQVTQILIFYSAKVKRA